MSFVSNQFSQMGNEGTARLDAEIDRLRAELAEAQAVSLANIRLRKGLELDVDMAEWAEVKAVRAENDRLRADYEKRGADLEALMTRCERAEAMLSVAVVRGNEYHAAIARVRELCRQSLGSPSTTVRAWSRDVLRALDGAE